MAGKKFARSKETIDKIFFEKIKEYNDDETFFTHYVRIPKELVNDELKDDVVMVVEWTGRWKYHLYPLENLEPEGSK